MQNTETKTTDKFSADKFVSGSINLSFLIKVNVKCTLVQALRLCTSRTAHRGSRGIALPFLDHGTRRGWGVSITPRPLFTRRKDPVPIVQEAGWTSGLVWTGAENLAPIKIRSPNRPARSQSLYRLCYSGHKSFLILNIKYLQLNSYIHLTATHPLHIHPS